MSNTPELDSELTAGQTLAKGLAEHLIRMGGSKATIPIKVDGVEFRVTVEPHPTNMLADILYTEYCKAVGGLAFNGDPLPDWSAFRADPAKAKQADAWMVVAKTATAFFRN